MSVLHMRRRQAQPQPVPVEWVACVLGKSGQRVELVLREHRLGTELRCIYQGDVLWTELIKFSPDHRRAVQRAVDDTRAAWETKRWHCECAGAIDRERPTTA